MSGGNVQNIVMKITGDDTVDEFFLADGRRVTEMMDDVFSRTINVKYPPLALVSAKGDNVTDDTKAIQTIIDFAKNNGYNSVFFPNGTYLVSKQLLTGDLNDIGICLTVPSHIRLTGNGVQSVLKCVNTNTSLCLVENEESIVIDNLNFVGNNVGSPHQSQAIRIVNSSLITVEKCYCSKWGSHGIVLRDGSQKCTIRDNTISDIVRWNGIELIDSADFNIISNNIITNSGDQGIEIRNSSNNLIEGNTIIKTGYGEGQNLGPNSCIGLEQNANKNVIKNNNLLQAFKNGVSITLNCFDNSVIGNTIEDNVEAGVYVHSEESSETFKNCDCTIIRGNVVKNNSSGIVLRAAKYSEISGNTIVENVVNGISLQSFTYPITGLVKSDFNVILGNIVKSNGSYGVDITNSQYCQIVSNTVIDNSQASPNTVDGIRLVNCAKCQVMNNICSGNRYGIRVSTGDNNFIAANNLLGNLTGVYLIDSSNNHFIDKNNILLGLGTDRNPMETYGTVIPTSGNYLRGDKVINTSPSAGGYVGWVCVVAGSPGTWKGYGLIQS